MADEKFDLFGDPCRLPNGKRGRPAHRPSQHYENKIKMLLALGWSNERIANACNISVPTLRKHYFSVLKQRGGQRDRLDARRFEQAFEAAQSGNVGAMRLMDQMITKNDLMLQTRRFEGEAPSDKQQKAAPPKGKKEQRQEEAKDAVAGNSDWGDDLKPGFAN